MNLRKSNSESWEKSPLLVLRMPITADGIVSARASAVCSIENVNFTTSKMQRPSAKKQMPVMQWIKSSWNQPIKKS